MVKKSAALILLILLMVAVPSAAYAGPINGGSAGSGSGPGGACSSLPIPVQQQVQIASLAPWYCPINNQIASIWKGDLPIAEIALLIAFSIASMIFAVGAGIKSDRIRNFGIGELYEATASAIIIILFLFVSAVMLGLIPSFVVGTINPYATALHLINNTVNTAESAYTSLFNIYITDAEYTSVFATITLTLLNTPSLVISVNPDYYRLPILLFFMEPAVVVGDLLIDGITALLAEYYLLIFFATASIPVFLVPGVIFRALFPTRAFGGMLIAIALGFYLVAPTLFALVYYFTAPNLLSNMQITSAQLSRFGAGTGAETNGLTSTSPLPELLQNVNSEMSSFWLLILFYPALIIAVTYAFITQVSNFIGGAIYTGSRLRSFI